MKQQAGPPPDLLSRLRDSHPAKTLRSSDTRIAAAVTLAVLLCVLAIARWPLQRDLAIDFREGDRLSGAAQATLIGFTNAAESGRTTFGSLARIVFNRPLPAEFVLEIEARLERAEGAAGVLVQVGRERQTALFDASPVRRELRMRNPDGVREIALRLAPGSRLSVQRIQILAQQTPE